MPADTLQTIYDFSNQLEPGFKLALLTNPSFEPERIFTLKDMFAAAAKKEFQWPRPRVEIATVPGAAIGHFIPVPPAKTERRLNGWHATLILSVITAADQTIHAAYCAAVRERAAVFDQLLDDDVAMLPFHQVPQCRAAGESPMMKSDEGYFETKMNYDFIFNIRPDAWPN